MNTTDIIFCLEIHRGIEVMCYRDSLRLMNDCQNRYEYQKKWFLKYKKKFT